MTTTRSVIVEREIAHKPEKIWRALTQGHLIAEWLMPNDFQPVAGHSFNFRNPPMPHWNGVIDCEVLVVEPGKTLSYSWNALGLESVVTFTLVATSGGTLVRMEQSGFRADQEANYQGAQYGWKKFIGALERVVDELG